MALLIGLAGGEGAGPWLILAAFCLAVLTLLLLAHQLSLIRPSRDDRDGRRREPRHGTDGRRGPSIAAVMGEGRAEGGTSPAALPASIRDLPVTRPDPDAPLRLEEARATIVAAVDLVPRFQGHTPTDVVHVRAADGPRRSPGGLEGHVQVAMGAVLEGDLRVEGHLALEDDVVIEGNVTASGDVVLGPMTRVAGRVRAGGDVFLDRWAEAGATEAGGCLHMEAGATVHGLVTAREIVQGTPAPPPPASAGPRKGASEVTPG